MDRLPTTIKDTVFIVLPTTRCRPTTTARWRTKINMAASPISTRTSSRITRSEFSKFSSFCPSANVTNYRHICYKFTLYESNRNGRRWPRWTRTGCTRAALKTDRLASLCSTKRRELIFFIRYIIIVLFVIPIYIIIDLQ